MSKPYLAYATAIVAAAVLSTGLASAQNTQAPPDSSAAAAQTAKPSPYQGVSTPPPDDTILTNDEPSAQPAAQPKPQPPPPAVAPPAVSQTANAAPDTAPQADQDAGMVVTQPFNDDDDDDSSTPVLKNRPATGAQGTDLDADIVTSVPGPANALPAGTPFRVHILQDVDAIDVVPGTAFHATLTQDLVHNGRIVVPAGSELRGKIIYSTYGRRIGGRSVIHLRADEFVLPDGTIYPLHAQVIDTQGSDTKVIGEGNIAAKDHPKVLLTKAAVATGGGALVGAHFGGPAGAAIGSAVGAGFIGAHWLLADHSAYVPAQSTIVFSLTDPMFLTPSHE